MTKTNTDEVCQICLDLEPLDGRCPHPTATSSEEEKLLALVDDLGEEVAQAQYRANDADRELGVAQADLDEAGAHLRALRRKVKVITTKTRYAVEWSVMHYGNQGKVLVWTSATPHLYTQRKAAQKLADRLEGRVIAVSV